MKHFSESFEMQKKKLESLCGGKVLFGAVGGSFSLGLQSEDSDFDVYIMVKNARFQGVKQIHNIFNINGVEIPGDYMCVDYSCALEELRDYVLCEKKYPTKLNYTDEEKERYIGKKDVERPDFSRSLFYRIFLADEIVGREAAKEFLREHGMYLKTRDIVDYQFSRLYGNYTEKIKGRETVLARKYLYCMHQILTCKELMAANRKPPMDFLDLVQCSNLDSLLNKAIMDIYRLNTSAKVGKEHLLVAAEEHLNRFICDQIDLIRDYLEKKDNGQSMDIFL